jgi:hypothetical protein
LESRGFFVAAGSHANYCQTELSMASSLNMATVDSMLPQMDRSSADREPLDRLIEDSAVSERLRRAGYAYFAVTTGFPGFSFRSADIVAQYQPGLSLFESTLANDLPLPDTASLLVGQATMKRRVLQQAVETLQELAPPSSRPRFVIAHILAPHPPFVFNANGSPAPKRRGPWGFWDGSHYMAVGGTPEAYRSGYTQQIQFIDRSMLSVVDALLAKAETPPVIIIQGDHGSKMRLDQESLERTDLRECFGILNAYYVPRRVREGLYPGVTPVNSFRVLFAGLFGDDLPLLPDRSSYSTWSQPYRFTDVTARLRAN